MRPILILLLLTLATPALAVDGVLEINQACAVLTGCFQGDAAGFPVTISSPGSYRLTSNLTQIIEEGQSQDANFIDISTSGVSLDLGGFEISCSIFFSVSSCTGAGNGIYASGSTIERITVEHGSIVGVPGMAVRVESQSLVRDVAVSGGLVGISVSDDSLVIGNRVRGVGSYGITTGARSVVSNNAVSGSIYGLQVGSYSSVSGNTVYGSNSYGMILSTGVGYRGNTINGYTYPISGGGVNAGGNVCGLALCP